ncbi:hypothetical protein J437_LFUL005872 [Ladona fulva]|uniref:Probable Ufm1-specific protease 2 n=1 Tax=Ladona fulva TaxID=123851 RepID=A0A8K0P1A0_LADFU|nr:hypothetical protein J437_LFUL005872 [Ladona fulva]
MSPRIKLSKNILQRLRKLQDPSVGCLHGIIYKGEVFVLGFTVEHRFKESEKLRFSNGNNSSEITNVGAIGLTFPTEVDVVGVVRWYENDIEGGADDKMENLLQDISVTDNPLILKCRIGDPDSLKAECLISEVFTDTPFEIVTESELLESFILVRLKASLPLHSEFTPEHVRNSVENLRRKLSSGLSAFHFPKPSIFLTSSDFEKGVKGPGLTGEDMTVKELYNACFDDSPKKKKRASKDFDLLPVKLMLRPTRDRFSLEKNACAPVIQHQKGIIILNLRWIKYNHYCYNNNKILSIPRCVISPTGNFKCLQMNLPLDTLSLVHRDTKASHLYSILVESICNQLKFSKESILYQMDKSKSHGSMKCPSQPLPYHFFPSACGHFITLLYPSEIPDSELESERRALHRRLDLPEIVPLFRRNNRSIFQEDWPPNSPLINPHETLGPSGVQGGEMALVQGIYTYHHYMQDKMDDNGWGCAYRSLQTIISWFRFQGYTEKPIPTHQEIQKCLVDIGDKPHTFVGTKQWIGSTEVSFVLDSMLGVQSRIISVSSGEELETKGSELVHHFQMQGTPIMIGGGVLAHTILGVHFNSESGELKFLILDPHYTGGEDINIIQSKGWCGWKTMKFWDKTAYYNLCLPQRPYCI